jgi:MYXO-CTERM domain-containing protein
VLACPNKPGSSIRSDDCDDTLAFVHPDAPEVCDADDRDENCNGLAEDADAGVDPDTWEIWYPDADGDGFGSDNRPIAACDRPDGHLPGAGDCDDNDATIGGPIAQLRDSDGDGWGGGAVDTVCPGTEGFSPREGDCDEQNRAINPGASEVCDGLDNNCDGAVDAPIDCDGPERDPREEGVAGCGCATSSPGFWLAPWVAGLLLRRRGRNAPHRT